MTAPLMAPTDDLPSKRSEVMEKQVRAMQLSRDFYDGTAAVAARVREYLPQYPAELLENYLARTKRLTVFNAVERTVTGLSGMVFRRNPQLEDDVPKSIAGDKENANKEGDWENLDLAGTHGDVFLRERADDALADGHVGVFVDYPNLGGKKLQLDEERALNLRPYCITIKKSQIMSFRTGTLNGRTVLDQLVLYFCRTVPKGRFAEAEVDEYRVYRRENGTVTFEVWQKGEDDREPKLTGESGVIANQTEIPFVCIYGPRKTGFLLSKPPLADLAQRNLAYVQLESDQLTSMHLAGSPIPVQIGYTDDAAEAEQRKTGPSWCVTLPTGGDFKYVEHNGTALDSMRQKLEDLKSEMAILGLAMLQREHRAAETAAAKRMDKSASDSALAVFARNVEDGAEQILKYMANYRKEAQGGSIEINKDFESLTLDANQIKQLSDMVAAGQLSLDTLWAILGDEEVLPEDFDPEAERLAIQKDMPMPEPAPAPDIQPGDQAMAA